MSKKRRRRASPAPVVIIVLVVLALAFAAPRLLPRSRRMPTPPRTTAPTPPAAPTSLTAQIYFLRITEGKVRLQPVARAVAVESPARAALEALLSGDLPNGCERPLPKGVRLRKIEV